MMNHYYENRLEIPTDFIEWAKSYFPVYTYVRKNEYIRTGPYGGREVINKQLRKNSRFRRINELYFTIVLSSENKLEYHTYSISQSIDSKNMEEYFESNLVNLEILTNDKTVKIHYDPTTQRWVPGLKQFNFMGWYTTIYDYSESNDDYLETIFKKSPLRYLNYERFKQYDWTSLYENRKTLEQFEKQGMYRMIQSYLVGSVDRRRLTQRRVKGYRKIISNYDLDYSEFMTFIDLVNVGISIGQVNFDALPNLDSKINSTKVRGQNIVKLMNYLFKQEQYLSFYLDYIKMLDELKTPASTSAEFYPKNLVRAHDSAVESLNALKKELEEKRAAVSIESSLKYEYKGNQYCVVVPKKLQDILQEGKELSHCVGSNTYLEPHSEGKEFVMFVRLNSNISKALVTFSFNPRKKRIVQIHAYKNWDDKKDETREHFLGAKRFLEKEWLPWVEKGCKKGKESTNDSIQNTKTSTRNIKTHRILNQSAPALK